MNGYTVKYRILVWVVAVFIGWGVAVLGSSVGYWTLAITIPFILIYATVTSYFLALSDRKHTK